MLVAALAGRGTETERGKCPLASSMPLAKEWQAAVSSRQN
jgi:hypothetical protein